MRHLCKVKGCNREREAKGYCKAHYKTLVYQPKASARKKAAAIKKHDERLLEKKEVVSEEIVKEIEEAAVDSNQPKIEVQKDLESLKKLFLTQCQTRSHLYKFCKHFFNFALPDCTVSRFSDTNPFDMVWELYQILALGINPHKITEFICVAGRGSGKCCVKDTIVRTDVGLKLIQDIKVGDVVYTGWSNKKVLATFDEGVKEGVKITTKKGKKHGSFDLVGSIKHRIQALNHLTGKIEWIYMKDLVPGQIIYKSYNRFNNIDIYNEDYEKGWLIGSILGDGSVADKSNYIVLTSDDRSVVDRFENIIKKYFNIDCTEFLRINTLSPLNVRVSSKTFKDWFYSIVEGRLCYFKKLRTLIHSPDFLSGIISGLMDTDGSKDEIVLANKELIIQISKIINILGYDCRIKYNRKPPSTTKFIKDHIVTYHSATFTKLSDELLPWGSKRDSFKNHFNKSNEQFRYPKHIFNRFIEYFNNKYNYKNGWINVDGRKIRSVNKFPKIFKNTFKYKYIQYSKVDYLIDICKTYGETEWLKYLNFLKNGHYEIVDSVEFVNDYFYDLEVEDDHSYWSNTFISHNTLSVAIAQVFANIHGLRDIAHVGATTKQADRCYAYVQQMLVNEKVRAIVDPPNVPVSDKMLQKLLKEKSTINIGGEYCTLEIVPCTLKAVNGAHVSVVTVDELDTMTGEGLRAYKDISGMLDSRGGKKSLRINVSTRKSRFGLMEQQISSAAKTGKTIRRWTALEFSTRCPDDRSGTIPTKYFVSIETGDCFNEEEYGKLQDSQKIELEEIQAYDKCRSCPAVAFCRGDSKLQTSTSPMLKPIEEHIAKVLSEGPEWTAAQLYNLKPSIEGIVFKEFEERRHVKNWNELWKTLTKQEFPGTCTHDMFVKKCKDMKLECFAGIDFGWVKSPNTCVFLYIDSSENIYVVRADNRIAVSHPGWIQIIANKLQPIYRAQLYFPDPADPGDVLECSKLLPTSPDVKKEKVNYGVQIIKKLLKAPFTNEPKIFFAKETCQPLIEEFKLYHHEINQAGETIEKIATESDHYIDALRYILQGILGGTSMMVSDSPNDDYNNIMDKDGNLLKIPTADELASIHGISISNDLDTAKIGKIGKLSEIESSDDGDEGIGGGGGGFMWTF